MITSNETWKNETIPVGKYLIQRYNIITTNTWVHIVYEPIKGSLLSSSHGTITSFDIYGARLWYGKLATRELPVDIDKIPMGQKRTEKINLYYKELYEKCYDLIIKAFPEIESIETKYKYYGEIVAYGPKKKIVVRNKKR